MRSDEKTRVALLAAIFGRATRTSGIELGIGDDAAVLDLVPTSGQAGQPGQPDQGARRRLIWTIDEQVEGVHFRRALASWHDIGWRSFMAAASDVAAMGAEPWCALSALVLADDVDDASLEMLARGQRDAAQAVGAPVAGGNLSRGPVVSIATTLLGTCERAVTRGGARPGDGLWLAGRLGLAAAGFRALDGAPEGPSADPSVLAAIDAWRRPRALVSEGRAMAVVAHAAIDVSDGLARDSGHVAEASGVCLVFDAAALVADAVLVAAAAALGEDALDLALHGGEDYALVVASPVPIDGFRRVGDVTVGRGLALRGATGISPVAPRGFDHFTGRPRAG